MVPATAPNYADPNTGLTWQTLHQHLLQKFQHDESRAIRETRDTLSAFVGFPRAATLQGPQALLRATSYQDPWRPRNDPFGSWWFPKDLLFRAVKESGRAQTPDRLFRDVVRDRLMSLLAVSQNFNDFEQLWCLTLSSGQQLTGLVGTTRWQYVDSSLEGSYIGMGKLPGSACQYYFPRIPPDCVTPYPYRLGWRQVS